MPDSGGFEPALNGPRAGGAAGAFRKIGAFLRSIAGMPDYAAHIRHLRRYHPERRLPTEREFYEEFVRVRYGEGTTRCC
jgi:uncharacterized short protein YbdD (DUF466 family)